MKQSPNTDIAQRLQERFEFYVIALAFTLLGLSIQTASFTGCLYPDIFELLGWALLFTSGIVGLSRLEWIPVIYNVHANIEDLQTEAARLRQAQELGQTEIPVIDDERDIVPIEEAIQAQENAITELKPQKKKIDTWINRKYFIHKWSFVLGVLFLIISRGYLPMQNIIHNATNT